MATYIVDTSVVIRRFIVESYTPEAQVLMERMYQGDELYIPEFCLIECVNVFWKKVRFQGLLQPDAEQFIGELLVLPFQIVSVTPLMPRAFEIGLTYQLAVYDSLYIALALYMDCPLITVDNKQLNSAISCGVAIKAITDFYPL